MSREGFKKGGDFKDEVVAIDTKIAEVIKQTKKDIAAVLNQLGEKELKLAVLAETVDEFLVNYKKQLVKTTKKGRGQNLKSINKVISSKS